MAWQPPAQDGGIGKLLFGSQEGDSVIRGGFAMAFQRPGMSDFTGAFGDNQGISVNLKRDSAPATSARCRSCCATHALTLPATPARHAIRPCRRSPAA